MATINQVGTPAGATVPLDAYAFETLTPTASTGFTASNYAPATTHEGKAKAVLVSARTASFTFTLNGTTPVEASTGHVVAAGDGVMIYGYDNIEDFRCISATGTVACTFFR